MLQCRGVRVRGVTIHEYYNTWVLHCQCVKVRCVTRQEYYYTGVLQCTGVRQRRVAMYGVQSEAC